MAKNKDKPFKEALTIPDYCPGCNRSRLFTEYTPPIGPFAYYKLFCLSCRKELTREQIESRGRSYVAKYRGDNNYNKIKRARKHESIRIQSRPNRAGTLK